MGNWATHTLNESGMMGTDVSHSSHECSLAMS